MDPNKIQQRLRERKLNRGVMWHVIGNMIMYINTFYGILCHMCNSVTNPNTHEAYATIGYIHCAAGGGVGFLTMRL